MYVLSYPCGVRITCNEMFRQRVLRQLSRGKPRAIHRIPRRLRQIVATEHHLATRRPHALGAEHDIGCYPLPVDLDPATRVVFEVARDVLAKAEVDTDRPGIVEKHPVDLAAVAIDAHAPSLFLFGEGLRGHELALGVEEMDGFGGVDYRKEFLGLGLVTGAFRGTAGEGRVVQVRTSTTPGHLLNMREEFCPKETWLLLVRPG